MPQHPPRCDKKSYNGREYYCSMELAIMMIGGKWKPIIIWLLGAHGTVRFGELRRLMPNVSQKMLTQQLRELEADGLVLRQAHPENPPRVDYSLTSQGATLIPVLEHLHAWAQDMERRAPGATVTSVAPAPGLPAGTPP
ncbi:MAG: winged helix-turn-helix transcriptional regulator [Desulfovibrionaceae bacterium]